MSASQGRLRSAIQRIAREDPEIRNLIDGFKDRGGFDSVSTQIAGADDDRGICCDGSSSGNRNPGSDTRDPEENAKEGLDPEDPADISSNLSGVVDCETGVPISFDGGDWIPPEGWDSPSSPPVLSDWEAGFYYIVEINGSSFDVFSCSQARSAVTGLGIMLRHGSDQPCVPWEPPSCPTPGGGVFVPSGAPCGGPHAVSFVKRRCDEIYSEDKCNPELLPLEESWPADGVVGLAIKGGSIVGSKYDPENDGSYSAPRDEIELCDPETGDSVLIRPSADGGWKSIKSLDGDIDPDTLAGYLYRPNGQRVRQISPSEFRDDTV